MLPTQIAAPAAPDFPYIEPSMPGIIRIGRTRGVLGDVGYRIGGVPVKHRYRRPAQNTMYSGRVYSEDKVFG